MMYSNSGGSVITIGKFDGIHIGHAKLLREAYEYKKTGLSFVVFTFEMNDSYTYIYNSEEKRRLINSFGADEIVAYPFDDTLRCMPYERFVKDILIDKLNAKVIVVGDDFRFGYNREGSAETLGQLADKYGYKLIVIGRECYKGEVVSSSRIKDEITAAHIEDVNNMLGRKLAFGGEVVYGNQLGRKLGMPTINIIPDKSRVLPPNGVYSSVTTYNGNIYRSVTNIGIKPTVARDEYTEITDDAGGKGIITEKNNVKKLIIETHLFDFDEYIYGEQVNVELLSFQRFEKRFDGLEDLMKQMHNDRERARKHFNTYER